MITGGRGGGGVLSLNVKQTETEADCTTCLHVVQMLRIPAAIAFIPYTLSCNFCQLTLKTN